MSRLNPKNEPAATETVAVAAVLTLQVMLVDVTSVTGLLLVGCLIAALDEVEPATTVVQISEMVSGMSYMQLEES